MEADWDQYTSKLEGATGTNPQLLRNVEQGAVLDLGCGIGKHLPALDKATLSVGIDIGLPDLQKGKRAFPGLALMCGSAYHTLSASFSSNDLKMLALPGILFHKPFDSGGIQLWKG